MRIKIAAFAATTLAAVALSTAAQAGVVHCDAEGNKQKNGAVIGAIAGAIIGNNVSHKAGAPIVGAAAGAAAGSAIGCQEQKASARDSAHATGINYVNSTVTIRTRPTSRADRLGQLRKGDTVRVRRYEGDWAVVDVPGRRSQGYVSSAYLSPAN